MKIWVIAIMFFAFGGLAGWFGRDISPTTPKLAYSLYVPDSLRDKQASMIFRIHSTFKNIDLASVYHISRMVYGIECPGLEINRRVIPIFEFDVKMDSLYEMVLRTNK